jgi:hypothetical protein
MLQVAHCAKKQKSACLHVWRGLPRVLWQLVAELLTAFELRLLRAVCTGTRHIKPQWLDFNISTRLGHKWEYKVKLKTIQKFVDTTRVAEANLGSAFYLLPGFTNLQCLTLDVNDDVDELLFFAAMAHVSPILTSLDISLDIHIAEDDETMDYMFAGFPPLPVLTTLKMRFDDFMHEDQVRSGVMNLLNSCTHVLTMFMLWAHELPQEVIASLSAVPSKLERVTLPVERSDYGPLMRRVESGLLRELRLTKQHQYFPKENDPVQTVISKTHPLIRLTAALDLAIFYKIALTGNECHVLDLHACGRNVPRHTRFS